MPSKYRKRLKMHKKYYTANADNYKLQAHEKYRQNADAITERVKSRNVTDVTYKKNNLTAQRLRLSEDESYREKNKKMAKVNTCRRLKENEAYAQQNRLVAHINTKRRLTEDKEYAKKNREAATVNKQRRLREDEEYAKKNREMAAENTKRRRKENKTYREKNNLAVKINNRNRWASDETYRKSKRQKSKVMKYRLANNKMLKTGSKPETLTARQKYWRRRARLLTAGKERQIDLALKQKMAQKSHISSFDADLIFTETNHTEKKATKTLKYHHTTIAQQVATAVALMESENCSSVADLDAIFGCRLHTSSSEPYYWEQTYHMIDCHEVIPIDRNGQARLFPAANQENSEKSPTRSSPEAEIDVEPDKDVQSPHPSQTESAEFTSSVLQQSLNTVHESASPQTVSAPQSTAEPQLSQSALQQALSCLSAAPHTEKQTRWSCSNSLCKIDQQSVDGVNELLHKLASTAPHRCLHLYLHINTCLYTDKNPDKLGHSLSCSADNGCQSLLKQLRTVSSHFPAARSMVIAIYKMLRLSLCIRAVQQAKHSGDVQQLKVALIALKKAEAVFDSRSKDSDNNNNTDSSPVPPNNAVTETQITEQFGKQLREAAKQRDTYVATACTLCEQLKPKLKSLASLEKRKGFDSDKMTVAIEILYQHKTKHEDVEEFKEHTVICSYCADKLLGNKDVARSAFNKLAVVPTPECIKNLNLFERNLIKFCITCLTVVRLGHITGKRPQNELTAAMKGRIAYLPVDVEANAKFVPEDLLNIDSLCVLVAGQPTKAHKVWTSVVDLTKVHAALTWLRDNNRLYKDVPAYSVRDLADIIDRKLKASGSGISEPNPDSALLKKLDDMSKSYLYENFSVQPLSSEYPQDVVAEYQMQKINSSSLNIYDNDLDLKAFPELYPTAENGLRDARSTALAPSDFIKSRLLNADSKFRLNMNYLFHLFQQHEVNAMCHSVGHMLRTVTGRTLTAKDFHERLKQKDGELNSKMFGLMANVRGSREYFSKLAMDIKWMIRQLGPPTLFVTCSMAEWFSEPFIQYLRHINNDIPGVDKMTAAELCAMDPVNVSIHFNQKWNAIFSKLINKKDGIFGEVEDYFYRIEYQARGAGHTHTLLWIRDAPTIGKHSPAEVKAFINKISTCHLPDPETSPTLHELVTRFQVHRCNKYCTKLYKHNNKCYKKCRFGFPRPEKTEIELHDVADCLAVDTKKKPRKRLYHLPRTNNETNINDYNAALLLANQANVDIQYIAHLGSRLPYYITDYITKNERSEQDEMWNDIFTATKSMASNALSYMLRSIKNRQVGANEAADRLLGHKLFSKSRQLRFADLQHPDKVKRVLKPVQELDKIVKNNPNSEDIYMSHWVLDIYPNRPDILENSSLYELLSWYEKENSATTKNKELLVKDFPYVLRRRKNKPYIVTHQIINPNTSEDNKQLYSYYMLKLFRPWRSQENLHDTGKTFYESFVMWKDKLPEMAAYHENSTRVSTEEQQLEQEIKKKAQSVEEDGDVAEEGPEGAFAGCAVDNLQCAMDELLEQQRCTAQYGGTDEDYQSLNTDQRRIVDNVTHAVCSTQPIHLFVSGQGGTGKSRVISVLHRCISQQLSSCLPVVVAAPTGLAAFNIGGTTIHRLLSLPVEHGKPSDYRRLQPEQLTIIRATMKGLQLLIIDEISMVSSLTLLFIHLRLTEITCNNHLFGGISTVFFGDFLQLPPVKGNQPFLPVTNFEAKQRLGAVGTLEIWPQITYDELTVNVRQRGDEEYAKLVSNVRTGRLTDDQHKLLCSRLINSDRRATVAEVCDHYEQLVSAGEQPIILLPRTCSCTEVNNAMLSRIGTQVFKIAAQDTLDTIIPKSQQSKVKEAYDAVANDVTRTAGLEKELSLCLGAKVMLKRNKSVESGLVNGAVGTVVDFSENKGVINQVLVKFDRLDKPVPILQESCTFEVLKCVFYTRKQFPLTLSFGLTIHKSQGLSLKCAIIDAGPSCFGTGMIYVALSRVTTLQGLHLISLDVSKIVSDQKAIAEYNRLRGTFAPHLGEIPTLNDAASPNAKEQHLLAHLQDSKCNEEPDASTSEQVTQQNNLKRPSTTTHRVPHKKRATTHIQSTNSTAHLDVMITDAVVRSIYNYCQITSIDNQFQLQACERLNLIYKPENKEAINPQKAVCRSLQAAINKQTARQTQVHICNIDGDGNCLFRALSKAVTGSEEQHSLFRSYVVNHMMNPTISRSFQQLICNKVDQNSLFGSYLANMEQPGIWGTDKEIAAAASLLHCSILCYSKCSTTGKFSLQHFPPHFATTPECTSDCNHPSLYLVNSSGSHYETATVCLTTLEP